MRMTIRDFLWCGAIYLASFALPILMFVAAGGR